MVARIARRPAAAAPPAPNLRAIGCAVEGEADALAVEMPRDAPGPAGAGVTVVTPDGLSAEAESETRSGRPVGVCLTALSPGGLSRCGDLCKQPKGQFPRARVVVARRGETQDTSQAAAYLEEAGADFIGRSLKEVKAELISAGQADATARGGEPVTVTARPKDRRRGG